MIIFISLFVNECRLASFSLVLRQWQWQNTQFNTGRLLMARTWFHNAVAACKIHTTMCVPLTGSHAMMVPGPMRAPGPETVPGPARPTAMSRDRRRDRRKAQKPAPTPRPVSGSPHPYPLASGELLRKYPILSAIHQNYVYIGRPS